MRPLNENCSVQACMSQPHENLVAWQRADDLCVSIYRLTRECLPRDEQFGLISQLRRAAYSVAANIVEKYAHRSPAMRLKHTRTAVGSLAELGYGLHLARRVGYLSEAHLTDIDLGVGRRLRRYTVWSDTFKGTAFATTQVTGYRLPSSLAPPAPLARSPHPPTRPRVRCQDDDQPSFVPMSSEFHNGYIAAVSGEPDAIAVLERQRGVIDALRRLPAERAGHRYADGKWTVAALVGHLSDSERVLSYRLLRIARADPTPLPRLRREHRRGELQCRSTPIDRSARRARDCACVDVGAGSFARRRRAHSSRCRQQLDAQRSRPRLHHRRTLPASHECAARPLRGECDWVNLAIRGSGICRSIVRSRDLEIGRSIERSPIKRSPDSAKV